jgi:ABC-type transport system involved in multi-copper enzyme maturation permease subunit
VSTATSTPWIARDALTVARFELGESIRTRRILAMVLLFTIAGGLAAWGFSRLVASIESATASATGAPATARAGASLEALRNTPIYRDLLRDAVGEETAEYLARLPPMVLFFAWMALLFTPWLVLFTAADAISAEIGNRSIRYTLLRTGHLEYACGKFLGQAALFAAVIGLSGVVFFGISTALLVNPRTLESALGALAYWPRLVIHALPFLSLALLASSLARGAATAWALSLVGGIGLAIVAALTRWDALRVHAPVAATLDLLALLLPFGHGWATLGPPGGALLSDLGRSLAQAFLYLAAAHAVLRRRDL